MWAHPDDTCYWERIDRNGETIDNYFGRGSRVQVTIRKSDYEFYSHDCGRWMPVK